RAPARAAPLGRGSRARAVRDQSPHAPARRAVSPGARGHAGLDGHGLIPVAAVTPTRPRHGARFVRFLFALLSLGLVAISISQFRERARDRETPDRFVRRFGLGQRRPDEVGAMRLEPEPDLATGIAVHAALSDAARPPGAVGPGSREEQLAVARG